MLSRRPARKGRGVLASPVALWQNLVARKTVTVSVVDARVAGDTHTGRVRKHNEDSYLYLTSPAHEALVAGVADGMGGHEGGEIASYLAMHYIISEWNRLPSPPFANEDEVRAFLSRGLEAANHHLYAINQELRIRRAMGTTATIGVLWDGYLLIAHAGDSRCYRVHDRRISQLTSDQNWMTEMVQSGRMSRMEAALHPLSKTLSNCVGATEQLEVDFHVGMVQEGDRYLFCTDGISSMVDDETIGECVAGAESPAEAAKEVMMLALRNGGLDNLSAVCLFV